ncbi:MAG: M13-type metalloendopeptidase [Dermabacter sp.]|nr:M13-type metalloendopeptidase [Dermabacter sp.]
MTQAAAGVDLSQADHDVRAQDDLFQFVNGRWLREHEIPADKSGDSEGARLHDLSQERVRTIIEDLSAEAAESDGETSSDRYKIGALYRMFMDEQAVAEAGAAPLEPVLAEIGALDSREDLTRLSARADAPISIISVYAFNNINDPSTYQMMVNQSGLGLPDEAYYREEKHRAIREAYVDYLEQAATLAQLSGREGLADGSARELAELVMDLETRIARAHVDVVRARDMEKSNNPMDAAQRADAFPGFAWDAYFEGAGAAPEWVETVNVAQPEFTAAVAGLWVSEPLEVLRTWMALHAVSAASPYLSDEFVSAHFDFFGTTLSGTPEIRPRWKRAVSLVESVLDEALGREYVQRHFPPEAKARMDHLVAALIEAYRASITDLEWMTDETRAKALEKLEKFTPKIGYPASWREYSGLELDESSLLASVHAGKRHEQAFQFGKLAGPVNPDEWLMSPQTVNAYYNPAANEIVFPAAILQAPFFSLDADDAANFGGIGAIIGHGFDDQGSKFDGDGALKSWWTETDRTEFEKRTAALIEDFSRMSPLGLSDEHKVNGAFTVGENIGDLGGLSIALKAYLAEAGEKANEEIDGYTGVQRLFLSWALAWRGKNREAEAIRRLATDPHSPSDCRANGAPRHIAEFYDAFCVVEGDGMYLEPAARVSIW